jgi:hypothetical protein
MAKLKPQECPHCKETVTFDVTYYQRKYTCPNCGQQVYLPELNFASHDDYLDYLYPESWIDRLIPSHKFFYFLSILCIAAAAFCVWLYFTMREGYFVLDSFMAALFAWVLFRLGRRAQSKHRASRHA